MKLLLDTHSIISFYDGDAKISARAVSLITDPSNEKYVSPASYWEIAIKIGTGKYLFAETFNDFVQHAIMDNGFIILPIEPRHCDPLTSLTRYHNDPFDRMIIAQAMTEEMSILSADVAFDAYPILRLW